MKTALKIMSFIVLALVVAACGTNVKIENGELVVNSNFSINETLLNSGDNSTLSFNNLDILENAQYDIQDGQLVVSGDLLCGNDVRVPGSMTVVMNVTETGFINVEITDVTSDCNIANENITQAQDRIAESLAEAAQGLEDSNATLTFTDITLADDTLTIAFEVRAPLNNNN
ncbi:MAG: hypothetical protein WBC91_19530 [Phototrophicaceae bacterium]